MKIKVKIKILFWKIIGIVWNMSPRFHLPKYADYPIASTDIIDGNYDYPKQLKILYEWDEKGKHWIVFEMIPVFFKDNI